MCALGVKELVSDGFVLGGRNKRFSDIALLSLRTALKAYYSTYKAMQYSVHMFTSADRPDQQMIEANTPPAYCEAAAETILHFQHFIELVVKEILRGEHVLLADIGTDRPVVLHKLLLGEKLTEDEARGVRSLEFSESFNRLCTLIREDRVSRDDYGHFLEEDAWIRELNTLRNRIWHRGAYVLNYPALDELVGRHILPLVAKIVEMPDYNIPLWRHSQLKCEVNPMEEIISAYSEDKVSLEKIAYLKELGRAAYEVPYYGSGFGKHFDDALRTRSERAASHELGDSSVAEVDDCPVCGTKSLVVFFDVELEGEDPEEGTYDKALYYTYSVECRVCSFSVNGHLGNAADYGLPIPDYWKEI